MKLRPEEVSPQSLDDVFPSVERIRLRKRNLHMLANALATAWTHLHRLDPVLTHELYEETPDLQDALRLAHSLTEKRT